jgi:general secretion pathway protein G
MFFVSKLEFSGRILRFLTGLPLINRKSCIKGSYCFCNFDVVGFRPAKEFHLNMPALSHLHSTRTSARPGGRHRRARAGFTLLELLVVIVIIGLLAAYVGPKYFSQLGKSEVTVARAQIEAFSKALDTFRLDVGRYPATEEGLSALLVQPAGVTKWNGPYLKKDVPLDPWGHAYVYRAPGSKTDFDLISYGRDGQPGGAGEDADIGN